MMINFHGVMITVNKLPSSKEYIHPFPRDGSCTVENIKNSTGELLLTCYQVFPGITLSYLDAHIGNCTMSTGDYSTLFEITHCQEGRIEFHNQDDFYYLKPGDLAISRESGAYPDVWFPMSHYHGITISVDLEKAPKCLSCFLDDVNVQPKVLLKKYCGDQTCFVARSMPALEHIFSELYSVPPEIQKGYFKVKVLELFLFLSGLQLKQDDPAQRRYTPSQVDLVKEISKYLTAHMDSRITLEELSERFHASGTQIKTSFKGVYGVSLYNYIRIQKMESAARMLRNTTKTVSEIAGTHGYDNASKFAVAFRSIMGMPPNEYRKSEAESL